MHPWIPLKIAELVAQRPAEADEDVHFTESLVATVVEEFTSPHDVVLDPFAGYGTTLVVAERMGRRAIGLELTAERTELIRRRIGSSATVINGDARRLSTFALDPVDLCLTSPPYMTAVDHPENPLNAYETLDGDYDTYLTEIGDVFRQVADLLRPGGHAVVNVANIKVGTTVTTLAWDMAQTISRHLTLVQESFLCWDEQPAELTGDYCLIFQRPGA
jgi:DNA modification methylase